MQNTEIDYLDGEFTVQESEPSTIAELTELIGETAVVDETTSNLRYRNKYPRVYKLVSKEVSALGFARPVKETKTLKDGTIKEIHVSEMDHIRAFLKADEAHRSILQELFTKTAQAEVLYVKGERTGNGGKVSQAATDAANGLIAKGDDAVEAAVSKIEESVPGYKVGRDGDNAVTPESLARGIMALQKKLTQDALKASTALLG